MTSAAQTFAELHRLTPADAVAYLQGRKQIATTFHWQELWQEEHAHQFTVSRLTKADILSALQDQITRSVAGDLSRKDFARDAKALLQQAGWWGKKEVMDPRTGELVTTTFNPSRLKLIFDTNVRQAYAAGQWQRIQQTKGAFPYLRYVTQRDERVRATHRAWDNVTLPVDDRFWDTHNPPNGWRCRCRVVQVSKSEYAAGVSPTGAAMVKKAPEVVLRDWLDTHTGELRQVPAGIDPGFGYNVGKVEERRQLAQRIVAEKVMALNAPLGAAMVKDMGPVWRQDQARRLAVFVDQVMAEHKPSGELMLVGTLDQKWINGMTAAGHAPFGAEIVVRDRDIIHTFRRGKVDALDLAWYKDLPLHLATAQAVVLDTTKDAPALLLIYPGQGVAGARPDLKLVVRINYRTKRDGMVNIVETGKMVDATGIRDMLGAGYQLLDGVL